MNNLFATLEELENDYWPSPTTFPTKLVESIYLLRKKKLEDLNSNDIRLLISQDVGVKFIMPLALEILQQNLLEEALYYPGDLLLAVLQAKKNYWTENTEQKNQLRLLLHNHHSIKEDDNNIITKELNEAIINFNNV